MILDLDDPLWPAVVDRLIPADEDPGGWAGGVGDFLHRQFDDGTDPRAGFLNAGVAALAVEASTRYAGRDFPALAPGEQDELLAALAAGRAMAAWPIDPAAFIDLLARLCAQGFYGDAGNRGNAEPVGWRMVGYSELPPGAHWPAPEPAPGPTIGPDQLADHYDAVIVGAGAGGCVAAAVLAEAGLRVLLVDRGRSLSSTDLPLDHLRSERSWTGYPTRTGTAGADPRVVAGPVGERVVYAPDPAWSANAMTVGGGTRVYGAQAWRFGPLDFRMAAEYGVPVDSSLADWPFGYDELEPWYDQVEQELGVAGEPGGDAFAGPRTRPYPMPAFPVDPDTTRLAEAAGRLGLRTGPVPLAVNTVPFQGRPACVRCGACVGFACHAAAKNGSFNTYLPRALATGRCALLPETQALELLTGERGRVCGVRLAGDRDGAVWRAAVTADRVVLAAGAIETARLLLVSRTPTEPNGVGNGHDQVGRHLQSHVYAGAIGLFDEVVQRGLGPGPTVATNDFRHGHPGIVGGGMLANDFVPTPLTVWDTLVRLGVIEPFGVAGKKGMRHWWSRMQMIFGPVQEIPNPASRVQADPVVVDRLGMPVARLSGDIHPEDRRTARWLARQAGRWLTEAGARRVIELDADQRPEGPSGGQHQAGTCRMGTDPGSSVTDPWGRVWGHENVLVADGSVHVTNGGVNPVLTIYALALRNSTAFAAAWAAEPGWQPGANTTEREQEQSAT